MTWTDTAHQSRAGEEFMNRQTFAMSLLGCMLYLPAADFSIADEVEDESVRKCINTRQIRSTEVVDDRNILFYTSGKTVYHNILPRQCHGLARSGSFSYRIATGRLCNVDTIKVLDTYSRIPGMSCSLGVFHQISKDDVPAILEGPGDPSEAEPLPPAEVEDIEPESVESRS